MSPGGSVHGSVVFLPCIVVCIKYCMLDIFQFVWLLYMYILHNFMDDTHVNARLQMYSEWLEPCGLN